MTFQISATQLKSEISILRSTIVAARQLEKSTKIAARTKPQKRLALMIFHDLTNKVDSIHTLAAAGNATGPEIIARSAFENFVDLLNLYRHPHHYASYLFYLSAEHQRQGLQSILNTPDSPYSQSILKNAPIQLGLTVQQMLDMVKQEMDQYAATLTAQFRRPNKKKAVADRDIDKTTKHRANLAGESNEYEAMYRLYSRPAHGEIGSMLSSFVEGDNFVWPPLERAPSSLAVDLAIRMLMDSGRMLSKKLKRPVTAFKKIEERRDAWAKRVYGSQ